MPERHTGGQEPAPQESIFEEELKGFKRARLEGRISSEQLQKIKETLAAPDLKKLQKLRLTRDITGEDFTRLKNIFESKEPAKKGRAGAAEAASRVPEPLVGEKEMRELRAIKGLEGQDTGGEAAAGEVATVLKEITSGWKDIMRETKIPGAEILKNFSTKELVNKLGGKKILGRSALELIISAGVGGGTRAITRYGLGALTGGWGYALAAATGAVAGGLVEGTIAHHKELERQKGYKDEEFERFLLGVRESKKKLTEKIDQYLEYAHSKELAEGLPGYKEELRELLENKFARSAFWRGAAKGALIGAVGGAIGAGLSDWLGAKLGWKIPGAEEATKTAETLNNNALAEAMAAASADAFNKTNEKLVRAGLVGLDVREFTAVSRKGEGATQLARKLISDYINQHQALGDKKFSFSKAQLVYAEDWLQKYIFTYKGVAPQLGESFKFKGEIIGAALADAAGLSPAEIDNLNKNWVGKISAGKWRQILDYGNVYNEENDFATGIFNEAKRKSAAAGKRAAEELGRAAAKPPSPAATEAAGSWLNASTIKWGLGAIGLGLAGAAAYRFQEPLKRAGRDVATIGREFGKFAWEMAPSLPSFKRGGAAKPPEAAGAEIQAPGPVVDVEAQRREAEETQRVETARIDAARTETGRVEHEKKLAADPVRKLFQEFGQAIEPRDGLTYKALPKEAIDAGQGRAIIFDNYPDFCEHSRGLTPEQKAEAAKWETTFDEGTKDEKKYPTVGVWASKSFWDKLKTNPELERRFYEMYPKIKEGLLADEYRGLPEKEDPKKVIGPLIEELEAKFKGEVFYFHRNYSDNKGFSLEEEVEGLKKLSRVLEEIRGELSYYRIFSFMIGRKGTYLSSGGNCIMEVDPSLSEDQMREYIRGAQSKIVEISESRQESYNLREAIRKEHGFLLTNASYDKIDVGQEITALKTLQEVLRGFPVDTLKLATGTTILEIGSGEVRKTSAGDVAIYIPPGLSAEETRAYLTQTAEKVEVLRQAEA